MNLTLLEAEKTVARYDNGQARLIETQGHGATDAGIWITQEYLGRLSAAISEKLQANTKSDNLIRGFEVLLRQLDNPELVATVTLQTCLHMVAEQNYLTTAASIVGLGIAAELWAHRLTQDNPRLAARLEKKIKSKYGRVELRRKAAMSEAARHGFKQKEWSSAAKARAGMWLIDCALAALPEVFSITSTVERKGHTKNTLSLNPEVAKAAEEVVTDLMQRRPVYLPSPLPPEPWTAFNKGGPRDQRAAYASYLARSRHKDRNAAWASAIKNGEMAPALEALNALQATPWKINTRVLDVIRACVDQGIEVPGLPGKTLEMPSRPETEDDGQLRYWRGQCKQKRLHNMALVCDRVAMHEDLETAERMRDWDAFYTPMSLDWRGRVYGMTSFNFQRDDRVRALFQFAEGEPIGEDGLWWLKVHVANCGAFEKIDKRPLVDRVAWVDERPLTLRLIAENPLRPECLRIWKQADKPFLFLAGCLELASALAHGPSYVTALPVSFDGSCSGLQHLCAMTRAPEGSLVNLTPAEEPQDVYATVAKRVLERVTADSVAEPEEGKEWVPVVAKLALAHGIDRKLVKRNVMTYSYSSNRFGMAQQQQVDLMDELASDVLTGKRAEHPFEVYAEDKGSASVAAKYLAGHVYGAIEEVVFLPAQAMTFLQKLSSALAHEGKPLRWTAPTGLPWINRYHETKTTKVRVYMADRGVRSLLVATGEKPEIDKKKAANGVAPNFVHALDAAHLMLVANAAAKEGICIATVHDSFGCLASRARRFNQIIREQFVEMYQEHDVLAEVLAQAKHDLTPHNWQRLPEVPHQGTLELKGVLNAVYAFA